MTFGSAPYVRFAHRAEMDDPPEPEPLTAIERRRLSPAHHEDRRQLEKAYVGRLYVPTPQQVQCERYVHRTQDRAAYNLEGAQVALYVLGRPFLGKSTAVDRAAKAIHRSAMDETDLWVQGQPRLRHPGRHDAHMPVVRVQVRPDAQRRAVVTHIVNYCGYGTQGTANELTDRVAEFVAKHGVRLVVLDDVHNLATDRRDAFKIYNTIKDLNTELGDQNVAFVYVGNPDAAGLGNLLEHEQLSSRLITFNIGALPLDYNNFRSEETIAWQEYLTDWETALRPVLPDLEPGRLSADLGGAVWKRTRGYAGGVALLLKDAVEEALEDTSPRRRLTVTMEALKAALMPAKFEREMASLRSAA